MKKPKKIKARKMWGSPYTAVYKIKGTAEGYSGPCESKVSPHYVLPADAASVERMVEQMAESIAEKFSKAKITLEGVDLEGVVKVETHAGSGKFVPWTVLDAARAALAAIGIK